jgi:hypothetical protein
MGAKILPNAIELEMTKGLLELSKGAVMSL